MTLGERIKKLRKALDLTQQEFADQIGSKRNTIATYEMGRTEPSAAVVSLVCTKFNVNETWLRTGEGEMFVQRSNDDELAQVFSSIAASDDELIKRIIRAYWRLDDKEKAAVKKLIDGFSLDGPSVSPAAPAFAPARTTNLELAVEQEVDQEVERYRQQLLLEKELALQASSAKEPGAG